MPLEAGARVAGIERRVPPRPWLTLLFVAVLVAVGMTAAWEVHVRREGYEANLADSPSLWAKERERAIGVDRSQVVFLGASRTLFDVHLATFARETGTSPPIQLATVGSNPLVILEHLAADPTYAGTTIVGIVPGLAAAAAGPPVANPTRHVRHYEKASLADRLDLPMRSWLEERLALFNEDLTLATLLKDALDLSPRPNAFAPELPPHLASCDRSRQMVMIAKAEHDPAFRARVQQIWLPLMKGPPRPASFTEEAWAEMKRQGWASNLRRFAAAVKAIEGRGGRVIFHRPPSSGEVYALETRQTPRAEFWDRLLRETGAPGVSFEDEDELRGFECPEWSHLTGADAIVYTKRFVEVLRRRGLL